MVGFPLLGQAATRRKVGPLEACRGSVDMGVFVQDGGRETALWQWLAGMLGCSGTGARVRIVWVVYIV